MSKENQKAGLCQINKNKLKFDGLVKNIRFIIIDQLNNTNSLSLDENENLLLQKEIF